MSLRAEQLQFSKVVFFGDSLSDMANNQDGKNDQAPVTNKIKDGDSYRSGNTWVIPFVKNLKADGLLSPNSTVEVKPSIDYDKSIEISPWDSVDFAFSGDPSGGYPNMQGKHVIEYHDSPLEINQFCVINPTVPPGGENDLCGAQNRIRDCVANHTVDPDALYVIWAGPNDILQNQDLSNRMLIDVETAIKTGIPISTNEAKFLANEGGKTIVSAVGNITYAIYSLKSKGAQHFLVINLPNLGYTPNGWGLNYLYAKQFPQYRDLILNMYTNLTNGFNSFLKQSLDKVPGTYPVIQPDINQMFTLAHEGKMAAFPLSSSQVNTNPVLQWFGTCCSSQEEGPNYDPTKCNNDKQSPLCSGPLPTLPNNQGHYLFYNGIHPTTCAAKYIARFVESYIPGGKPFDPNEQLCSEDE